MTDETFARLLNKRSMELTGKAAIGQLNRMEEAELQAMRIHRDKAPAVTHRIRILSARMAEPGLIGRLTARFCPKFKQNRAELHALEHYGHSKVVWEIAYLQRKQATGQLSEREASELELLKLYHDSPDVTRITQLKLKERFGEMTMPESRELAFLQRNLYRKEGVPSQVFDLLWPSTQGATALDWSSI